ncbi:MAG: hypothetical protein ACUVXF_06805 [Desulfobaccales bacterium]
MAELRSSGGRYEARCDHCGRWQEVELQQLPCDAFFSHFITEFCCCGIQQVAKLTVEKDELDFH